MSYSVRTVFFSRDIISLFGVVQVYDHLPHGWWRYEGKTFYRVQGKLKEIKLENLFSTNAQREFLRNYCEEKLKAMANSYFFGQEPLLSKLEFNNINSFAINDKFLIIFFQPYTVGGLEDVPIHVKIPYGHLVDHWNASHLFSQLLRKTIVSKLYTASWDQEDDFQMEITDCLRNTSQMITMKKTSEGGAYVSTQ